MSYRFTAGEFKFNRIILLCPALTWGQTLNVMLWENGLQTFASTSSCNGLQAEFLRSLLVPVLHCSWRGRWDVNYMQITLGAFSDLLWYQCSALKHLVVTPESCRIGLQHLKIPFKIFTLHSSYFKIPFRIAALWSTLISLGRMQDLCILSHFDCSRSCQNLWALSSFNISRSYSGSLHLFHEIIFH